ncbi:MAG: D-tyrosyl-tRNA(Tyr) deacylase [Omnitrophica bacterium RIFCSPLOWO2_12_FULL_44_17]|uniref:D-aminoacyl-tRNA deacylase n=1 Tax=Candidatus Danuiimicrobium aquiferis TaxID=1801832 RepID=A0A1G1L2X0_9BACT|nr:MAG: D-tyrosyl-tRNA(Tyr) deacylase [Omnitrophica bacterium RIFCSPHIGHO2_02_FULL_45_28]OGW89667.1 MAG: D-tyrosyl-tRNA(Tyr) deacylase [Omnitrophica bacterium RIFCSPHIGHO2_12_FULL_44_12]OGW99477.1 MAG: D-tyrosyl-tRNA(Tyr) deacylase [Omnitrophica bacterium RIFCSPLOWO2_12_FULL_44_17]OGX04313.1 MAG: D-tyrosyl-tRNA(Tyr) deacylase [Omnitrophica bacterium RIFCSPLOWO2_02_FULL_44_11]
MRILIQRVKQAYVVMSGKQVSAITKGLLLFVGMSKEDTENDLERLAEKVLSLRIFEDEQGKMNLNIFQAQGEILSVPQFTLYADLRKGNRPGFEEAADPKTAEGLWKKLNDRLRQSGLMVGEGVFGAHMEIELVNDGPVTIWLDSRG